MDFFKQSAFHQRHANRWVVVLLVVALSTVGILLGRDLLVSHEREFAIQRKDAANLSDVIERHVRAVIEKIDVVLLDAVHDYEPVIVRGKRLSVGEANRDLLRREAAIPEAQVRSLRVIDAQGQVVFSAGDTETLPKVNVADRAYFITQRDQPEAGLVMSEPILSRFTGQWLFTLSRRLTDADGHFAGLVQTALRADYFESGLMAIDVGNHGNLSLFSLGAGDIRLMARRPPLPDQLGKPLQRAALETYLAQGMTQGGYSGPSAVDGVQREFYFRKFQGLPLVVVVGASAEDFLKGWVQKAWLYALSLVVLAVQLVWLVRYQRKLARENEAALEGKVQARTVELSETNDKLRTAMQAAEAANVAKTQFLATMSHELRTPLNGILGTADLLLIDGDDPELRKEFLGIISQSGQTLLSVLNSILDLSKIEAGKLELNYSEGNPLEPAQEVVALFQPLAARKALSLALEAGLPTPTVYRLDEIRLKQMLGNLVNNAIKFTAAGQVVLRVSEVADEADGTLFRFAVQDTGTGIAPEKLPLLFQPFSQVDSSSTRSHEGTGLGLSIVRRLAELMGGEVGVESQPGVGSTFWFTVRLQKA